MPHANEFKKKEGQQAVGYFDRVELQKVCCIKIKPGNNPWPWETTVPSPSAGCRSGNWENLSLRCCCLVSLVRHPALGHGTMSNGCMNFFCSRKSFPTRANYGCVSLGTNLVRKNPKWQSPIHQGFGLRTGMVFVYLGWKLCLMFEK